MSDVHENAKKTDNHAPVHSVNAKDFCDALITVLTPRKKSKLSETDLSHVRFLTELFEAQEFVRIESVPHELQKDLNRRQDRSVVERLKTLLAIHRIRMQETSENESHLS